VAELADKTCTRKDAAMEPIDRRAFLKTSAAALALAGTATATPASRLKKAYMLGGDTPKGGVLERFRLLKDAGFEGVEINSPGDFDRDEILKARDETGLVIHGICDSAHWRDTFSDPDDDVVARGMKAARTAIADAKLFGATTVLVVPAVVSPKVSHRQAYERSLANIRKLIPDAEAAGVKIAIEEVWNKFLLTAPEFARYVDAFHSPAVGAYFDVGNVVEYGYPQEWIRELGPRILKVHVKEYAKPKRFDYPLGEGKEIDWPAVKQAFADIHYDGWITAEVARGDLAALKDVARRMDQLLG